MRALVLRLEETPVAARSVVGRSGRARRTAPRLDRRIRHPATEDTEVTEFRKEQDTIILVTNNTH